MIRALLVDDEEDICLMVSRMLEKVGIHADYVLRIAEARKQLRNHHYDWFVLDLSLPDGTGFDIMEEVRKLNPKAKILVISAYDGVTELEKAEAFGVDTFLKKPFTQKQILAAIQQSA